MRFPFPRLRNLTWVFQLKPTMMAAEKNAPPQAPNNAELGPARELSTYAQAPVADQRNALVRSARATRCWFFSLVQRFPSASSPGDEHRSQSGLC